DGPDEATVVAPRFAVEVGIIGNHVGRVAGTPAVVAAKTADVGSARAAIALDFAEPARLDNVGEGQGGNRRGGDALFGVDAGVGGPTVDFDFPVLRPDGTDRYLGGRAAVHVEPHFRFQ